MTRAAGRRLNVGVGQPGMKREQRHLDRKRQGKGGKQPALGVERNDQLVQVQQIEGHHPLLAVVQIGYIQDRHQHQQAADHGVQQKFEGRINAARPAPDADQEIHRDQHDLPEHVEQEQVNGHEGAQHAGLQEQEKELILLDPVPHITPAGQQHQRGQKAGQQHQKQADAVHPDVVLDAEILNPGVALDKLEVGRLAVETGQHAQRHDKGQQRRGQPRIANPGLLLLGHKEQVQGAQHGQKDEQAYHR